MSSGGLKKGDANYGKPVAGSKTEARAKKAHERISNEIVELVRNLLKFFIAGFINLKIWIL